MTSLLRSVPAARSEILVTTTAADEVLVYDRRTDHIHHLNATTTAVWHACDGARTVDEIATVTGTTEEGVQLALTQLANAELLAGPLDPSMRLEGHSRRRFLKRAVVAGAVAVPALVSISAPVAAGAVSPPNCDKPCPTFNGDATCVSIGGPCNYCRARPGSPNVLVCRQDPD